MKMKREDKGEESSHLISFARHIGYPVVAPRDQLERIVCHPEQLLSRRTPSPALLVAKNHSLGIVKHS